MIKDVMNNVEREALDREKIFIRLSKMYKGLSKLIRERKFNGEINNIKSQLAKEQVEWPVNVGRSRPITSHPSLWQNFKNLTIIATDLEKWKPHVSDEVII